jgi:hypothetical protein
MAEDTEHPPASPSEDDPGEQLPLVELETILNQPPALGRRLVQIGLGLAALVVVFVTFWGVIRPKALPASGPHAQPTEAPPTLLITSNVNYGTITINGQKLRGAPPLEVKMHTPPPYQITLDAPPFQSFTCTFPGCGASGTIDANGQAVRTTSLVLYPTSLPAAQQSQVNALVSQAISVQQGMDVPAGASIAVQLAPDETISSQQATEPLQATALLVATAPPNQFGVSCAGVICVDSLGGQTLSPSSASSGHLWQIGSFIALRWRFTTAAGAVVSEVTYPMIAEVPITLAYDAATGWQIAPQSSGQFLTNELAEAVRETGAEMLQVEQARYLSGEGWDVQTLHQQGTAGCEYQLVQNNVAQGQFVWRFGVLLAADAAAHNTLPTLPIASPEDIAAVGG